MNNSVVFNKMHMRNRIFNLHLFLSCSFMKSHVQKLLCLVFSSEQSRAMCELGMVLLTPQHQATHNFRPSSGLSCIGSSKLRCYTSTVCQGKTAPISQAWEALWNLGPGGTYTQPLGSGTTTLLEGSTPCYPLPPAGLAPGSLAGSCSFAHDGTWHLHLAETLLSYGQTTQSWYFNRPLKPKFLFNAYRRLQLILTGSRQAS